MMTKVNSHKSNQMSQAEQEHTRINPHPYSRRSNKYLLCPGASWQERKEKGKGKEIPLKVDQLPKKD
jgi:hypothetical protein